MAAVAAILRLLPHPWLCPCHTSAPLLCDKLAWLTFVRCVLPLVVILQQIGYFIELLKQQDVSPTSSSHPNPTYMYTYITIQA